MTANQWVVKEVLRGVSAVFVGAVLFGALSTVESAESTDMKDQIDSSETTVTEPDSASARGEAATTAARPLSSAARHAAQFALRRWIELPPPKHLMVTEYENMLDNELKQVQIASEFDLNLTKPVRWSNILVRHVAELSAGDRDRGMLAIWIEDLQQVDDTTYILTWRQSGSDEFGHRIAATVSRRPTKVDPATFEWYVQTWDVGAWQPSEDEQP